MALGNTLLERLEKGERESRTRQLDTQTAKRLSQSVREHLNQLFNTRQGSVMTHPEDYGLPDFGDMFLLYNEPVAIEKICQSIRNNIEKFEPRLTAVRVQFVGKSEQLSLHLEFAITAKLSLRNQPTTMQNFRMTRQDSGQIRVVAS